ncbi:MAG: acyltransferase [Acidobacteriaceae bacterium]|nr:acyltransferase [Acidobacteriaceae bacterium]
MTVNFPNCMDVGRDVFIGVGAWLHAAGGITLEDGVQLGPYVALVTGDHTMKDGSYRYGASKRAPIRLCSGSWVGAHATLTKGVTLGRGSLVAANAVVTTSIPDFTLAAGVPARVIKRLVQDEILQEQC